MLKQLRMISQNSAKAIWQHTILYKNPNPKGNEQQLLPETISLN